MKISIREYLQRREEILSEQKENGIGILFEGVPSNLDKFIDIMEDYGCTPVIARQITNHIILHNFKKVTVQSLIPNIAFEEKLLALGVKVSIIEPINSDHHFRRSQHQKYVCEKILNGKEPDENSLAFDRDLYEKELKLGYEMFEKYGRQIGNKWRFDAAETRRK